MKKSFHFLLVIGLVAGLLLVPAAVSAETAEVTHYTGLETPSAEPAPEPCLETGPGVKCFQESYWHDVTDDWRTTGWTTVQANFKARDESSPNGHIWGTFVTSVYVDDDPTKALLGTWEGTWTGKIIDGGPFFKAVGHGTGQFDGLKMMANFSPSQEGIVIEGRILDPHQH
jgi:hypothetical protein